MKLVSSAFTNYGSIPSRYTYDGENIASPLQWEEVSKATNPLFLVCDDPDASKENCDHWIIFNLLVWTNFLPEGENQFSPKNKLGKNGWGKENYDGPCPTDKKHCCFFKLYALNTFLELPSGITKQQIQWAMKERVIEKTELAGFYARPWQKK